MVTGKIKDSMSFFPYFISLFEAALKSDTLLLRSAPNIH
mgnify:CR=1 FL=1